MKNYYKIFLASIFMLGNILINAQIAPPPPSGGQTPETAASPIDMYVYVFALVAIFLIVYFAKKNQKKLI